jgi:hypothetical protein
MQNEKDDKAQSMTKHICSALLAFCGAYFGFSYKPSSGITKTTVEKLYSAVQRFLFQHPVHSLFLKVTQ